MNSAVLFAVLLSAFATECFSHGHRGSPGYRRVPRPIYQPRLVPSTTEAPPTVPTTTVPCAPATTVLDVTLPGQPSSTPLAGPDKVKNNEGFFGVFDKYDSKDKYDNKYDSKDKYNSKYDKKKYYYKKDDYKKYKPYEQKMAYQPNDETCYEIITSDNPYSSKKDLSFNDISGTGTAITFAATEASSAVVTVAGAYKFYDEYVTGDILVTTSGSVVFDLNSAGAQGADFQTPNLANRDKKPFEVVAPFWTAFTLQTGLNTGAVYWLESNGVLTVQWNVNEQGNEASAGGIFQVRFTEGSSDIVYAYNQLNCVNPLIGSGEFGIKPTQGKFSEGQRSSLRISSCINGAYQFPRDNTGVWLKQTKCSKLIGQTGIKKSTKKGYVKQVTNDDYKKYKSHGEEDCNIDDYFNHYLDVVFDH